MGNWNISQPFATTAIELTSGQDIHQDHTLTTMASCQDELLHKLSEMENSLGQLLEIKKSVTALSTQQTQVVDLKKSMMESFAYYAAIDPKQQRLTTAPTMRPLLFTQT